MYSIKGERAVIDDRNQIDCRLMLIGMCDTWIMHIFARMWAKSGYVPLVTTILDYASILTGRSKQCPRCKNPAGFEDTGGCRHQCHDDQIHLFSDMFYPWRRVSLRL